VGSLEILKSWIDLIDDNGWVAREQILGEEARSKVKYICPTSDNSFLIPVRSQQNSKPKYLNSPTRQLSPWPSRLLFLA
jgi:hypothetical protein